jgi:hypothetical protein
VGCVRVVHPVAVGGASSHWARACEVAGALRSRSDIPDHHVRHGAERRTRGFKLGIAASLVEAEKPAALFLGEFQQP